MEKERNKNLEGMIMAKKKVKKQKKKKVAKKELN
jgi:hypothetical protein